MVTGHFIYYKIAGANTWLKTDLISAENFSHTVDSLTVDVQYALKIVAVNEKGESAQSNIHYQYAGAVPTGLSAPSLVVSSRTDTSVTIVMTEPDNSSTDILGYQIYANDANSNSVPTNLVYDGQAISSVLSVTVRGLESGQGYWLAYRVLNRAGWSEMSPYLVMIAGRLPSPPGQNPHQISVSPTAVSFGWVPPTDIGGAAKLDGYKVYSGTSTLLASIDPETLEYTLDGLLVTPGDSYSIRISSFTAIGEGAQSNPLTIWAIDLPDAPILSRIDTNSDSCSVQWTAVTPPSNSLITGYMLYVDDGLDGDYTLAYNGMDKPSTLAYTADGLVARRQYRLKVTALNKAGEGAESDPVTCYTVSVPGQPGTPRMITSTASSIELAWEPAYEDGGSPILEYQLEMDEVEGIGASNIESWTSVFTGHALTYTVSAGLQATYRYRFRVRAVSEYLKESPYSSISVFYAAALPEQITFPTDVFTEIEKDRLTFTWNQPVIDTNTMLTIDQYRVYWDAGYLLSGNFELKALINSHDQFHYEVQGLQPGTLYRFQVSAVNAIGEGSLSGEV